MLASPVSLPVFPFFPEWKEENPIGVWRNGKTELWARELELAQRTRQYEATSFSGGPSRKKMFISQMQGWKKGGGEGDSLVFSRRAGKRNGATFVLWPSPSETDRRCSTCPDRQVWVWGLQRALEASDGPCRQAAEMRSRQRMSSGPGGKTSV